MNGDMRSKNFNPVFRGVSMASLVNQRIAPLLVSALVVGITGTVNAQSGGVSVDLSVLTDGGYTNSPTTSTSGGALLMPGTTMPRSSYFGPAVTVINPVPEAAVTTAPATTEPALSASDTVPPPEPEAAPAAPAVVAEPVVAATEQTDVPSAPPEPAESETPALPAEPEVMAGTTETTTEDTGQETASTTAGPVALEPGRAMLVVFSGSETKLPTNAESDLDAIAATVSANEDLRIQLMAYAGGQDLSSSKARRMSLSRALAVRSYFIEMGVRSTRIDVRALGDKTDEEPINRVDVNITER